MPALASGAPRDFVLGIDFGGTKIALAIATLDGEIVESERLDTDAARGATQAVDRALAHGRSLIARAAEALRGGCVGVGAVSPGIVHPDRILLAPNVPGWEELSLPALLRAELGIDPVEVGTDVKAAALAESRWGSLQGADPAVLLTLGTGVAAGIVVDGEVLAGANGAAGEVGYNLRGPADEAGARDGRAPLEEFVGGRAIGERASRLLGRELTAADVFAHADPRARFLIDGALAELAFHVANLAILVDPARIAVGGGLMNQPRLVLAALAQRLHIAVPFPPQLVTARFVHDGPVRGAIALAVDAAAASRDSRSASELASAPGERAR